MFINKFFNSFLQAAQVPLAGILLSIGFATSSANPISASELEFPTTTSTSVAAATVPASESSMEAATKQLHNGTYLYGQSSKPEQIGKEYLVFEGRDGKVIGAYYMPFSEFSCFYGTVNANQMDLNVIDPYGESTYSHSIALQPNSLVASNREIGLQGYQPLATISNNDQQILRVCRDKYQQQIWNQ